MNFVDSFFRTQKWYKMIEKKFFLDVDNVLIKSSNESEDIYKNICFLLRKFLKLWLYYN